MTDIALAITASFVDNASSAIAKVGSAFGPVGNAMAMATAALADFGQQSVQVATQYDQSQRMIQSLTGASNAAMQQYDTGVKQLAADTGVASTQLSGGLYNMISAGYSGSDALKMLTLSTKDAVIGMTNSTVTSNALTTVMRGFGVETKYADAVNGEMIRTVTAGKMTMQDYAGAVSKTSSTAVQYKDTMVDMNAVLATLTSNGIKSAAIAGTDYDNLLKVLNGDTTKMIAKAKALNPAFDGNAFSAMNVSDKIKYLNDEVVKHGHNITDVMGRQQNAAAAFTILANNTKMYGDNLKNLGDAQANANATQSAWAITQQGLQVTMNRVNAIVQNLMITLGNAFLPVLTQVMNGVANVVAAFSAWITSSGIVQTIASGLSAAFANVGNVIQSVVGVVQGSFSDLPNLAQNWGSNMMDGFIAGVENSIGALINVMNNIMSEVSAFIGFASPSKKGPGKRLMSWGPGLMQGFAGGILSAMPIVQGAVNQVAQSTSDGLQSANTSGAGSSAASGASSSFVSIGSGLQTVSLGHPFGMAAGTGGGAKANPLTGALSTHASALAATTSKHAASVAASTAKHATAVASSLAKHQAALQKHAASVAAALAKHQAASAKHAASVAASTKKHATAVATATEKHKLAMEKHAASVAAALKRHEAVLAREAATKARVAASKSAKGAKGAGKLGAGGLSVPIGGGASPLANGLKATQDFAQGVSNGVEGVKTSVNKVSSAVNKGFKSVMNGVKPAIDGAIGAIKTSIAALVPLVKPTLSILVQVFKGLWQTLLTIGGVIGTTIMPALANLVSAIAPIVVAIVTWIAKSGIIKVAFDALGVAIKVVATVLGALINGIANVIKFFTQTQVGQAILQATIIVLGTLAVIIGVVALALVAVLIPGYIATAVAAAAAGIAMIAPFLPLILIILAVIAVVTAIILVVKNWGAIAHWLQGVWKAFSAWIIGLWIQIKIQAIAIWFTITAFLQKLVGSVVQWLKDTWKHCIDAILGAFQWLYDHNKYIRMMVDAIVKDVTMARDWLTKIWTTITDNIKKACMTIYTEALFYWTAIHLTIQLWMNKAYLFLKNIWDTVVKTISDAVTKVWKQITDMWTTISTIFGKAWDTYVGKPLGDLWNRISKWFDSLGTGASTAAKNFINMLATGISNGSGVIWDAVKGIAAQIWKGLGFSSPTKDGPGKTADKWMPNLTKMMAKGLTDGAPAMQKAANNVAGTLSDAFNNPQTLAMIRTSAGVALPNYDAGTGQTIADRQPVMASSSSRSSSAPVIGELHIHLDKDASPSDTNKVTQEVQKQLARMVRGQAITPRNTSGGH